MTAVFPLNIPRSIIRYAAAGRVDKARSGILAKGSIPACQGGRTPNEHCCCQQCAMVCLKSFQQRGEGNGIQQHMEEAEVN